MVAAIRAEKPDMILVHGDTTTTLAASLAAFYEKVPVGHVEAGLRTGNLLSPWPEEANRKLTGVLAAAHFAPTASARDALLAEGVDEARILTTGNTVIDALLWVRERIDGDAALRDELAGRFPYGLERPMVLITGHRRESFGGGFERICQAVSRLAEAHPDTDFVYPVHLNPNVQEPVNRLLSGAFAGQAGAGDARHHRAPGRGGRWHGEAGGHRRRRHPRRSAPPAHRPGRLGRHEPRPQPLRRRPGLPAYHRLPGRQLVLDTFKK